jgi:hypothetical protein
MARAHSRGSRRSKSKPAATPASVPVSDLIDAYRLGLAMLGQTGVPFFVATIRLSQADMP